MPKPKTKVKRKKKALPGEIAGPYQPYGAPKPSLARLQDERALRAFVANLVTRTCAAVDAMNVTDEQQEYLFSSIRNEFEGIMKRMETHSTGRRARNLYGRRDEAVSRIPTREQVIASTRLDGGSQAEKEAKH